MAIYQSDTKLGGNIILVNGERIYDIYNKFLPKDGPGIGTRNLSATTIRYFPF